MEWHNSVRRPRPRPAGFIEPCNPTVSKKAPSGPLWIHEIKHDGYRMILRRSGDRARIFTRRGFDWSDRYPVILKALQSLKVKSVTIDGEAVWCGPDGIPNFEQLHSRAYDSQVFLYAFDLLELDGVDYRELPLEKRKKKLKILIARTEGMHFVEHAEGDGPIIFEHACKLGLEGIVSKRRDLGYMSGNCRSWLKIKNPAAPAMLRLQEDGA
jgi:bifunctional non-homologous end joining protein LigD